PRYPFGASEINAPSSNLGTLVENGTISAFSPIQAILTLPNLQRVLPSLLETPEISDPRLIANSISKSLNKFSNFSRPVFLTTFFSTAHFPYASPGPWYAKFQKKDTKGNYIFRKTPDQIVTQNDINIITIPEYLKEQTISLYDSGLNAIDDTLKDLFDELNNKGWLKNSMILIFGDHGENLYEGNLGMGHGDGVAGEHSNVTPLVIFLNGNAQVNKADIPIKPIIRTIDIAPTIARRINVKINEQIIDGEPLLDVKEKISDFPENSAYMETGIWFTSGFLSPENHPRMIYPKVTSLIDIDAGMNFEFYIRPSYSQSIPGVKERAWINETYRLIARTTKAGVSLSLHLRTDKNAKYNLLEDSSNINLYQSIAKEMLNQMNKYLTSRGVEIIRSGNGSFFYAENVSQ
ncbi:MAG: sulfatase-like hydrolase/transferase, partial [Silvanigrellaceae bacterium]|nr:sulfatase-like hydrolase/transferase [Silvanigrellaceae bacterium]